MKETCILINTKDRPSELALLLQSLRASDYQDFDIYILDDMGGTPLNQYYFLTLLITRMLLEGHQINIQKTEFPHGVSRARQAIVDWAMQKDYKLFVRLDDDVLIEKDYLSRLKKVIEQGYDISTGVTIPLMPTFKRDPKFLKGIVNRIVLDSEGKFLFNGDSCGMPYIRSEILLAHHFRSCAMMKRIVHEKIKYYPTKLSMNGYREEEIFSLKALMEGFKIGCDTLATTLHLACGSGGERPTMHLAPFNQSILEEFVKENKDKIIPLTSKYEDLDSLEYMREDNLLR